MTGRPFDVFGLGQCAYDRVLRVPRFPGPHGKVEGADLTEQCGGPVATALWTLALWGRRVAFSGVVGDDEAGSHIHQDLADAGVDVSGLLVRPGERSQEAFVAVEQGTGERRITWQRPTGRPPAPDEIDAPEASVFLTDGLYAEPAVACARASPLVVVDAGTLREGTEALLDHADVYVASEVFARALVGRDDPREACLRIRERGAEVAAVTLGARGWVASFHDRTVEGPAWPVEVVDTTGCGDVFHAGVVEGLLAGWPHERTLDFAAWAAARCATRMGGRAGVPPQDAYPGPRTP